MKFLPPNATELEQAIDAAIENRLSNIDLSPVSTLWNPDTCPLNLLPWLAWAESVKEWSEKWSEPVQRATIKANRSVRRKRGTKQAVIDAVAALSGIAVIQEWFDQTPPGAPHTFDIVISGNDGYVESGLQQSIINAIDNVKRLSSHYTLGVGLNAQGKLNFIGVAQVVTMKRLNFEG